MGNANGLSGIISIFGLIFGIFLAVIGIGLVQDLVVEMNSKTEIGGQVCADNPVWGADLIGMGEICVDVAGEGYAHEKVTMSGVGLVMLMSMLMLIFFVIFAMFLIFLIPPLSGNLPALLFFSIFFLLSFMLSYFLGLNIVAVFY
ncbi:MAG: hypothetical protein ACXADO_00755 [Candidatus Thorarchaeota archaeon]|jgi:hypothetical protein